MKKTVLLSIFLIFTAVSSMADVKCGLESCVRYGTEVLITFSIDNKDDYDHCISFDKHDFLVLDAEGNEYMTSEGTYGTLKERSCNNSCKLIGIPEDCAPVGSNEICFTPVTVPAGVKVLVRVVASDVPETLKQFDIIQWRGKNSKGAYDDSPFLFCFNWNQAEDHSYLMIESK
ncbi:hypothetical protein [Prevotella sp.]|uniref:hypothetical protein n=1 Tax=Prevotella sp. TaxID=59823 RepID=UPI003FD8763B